MTQKKLPPPDCENSHDAAHTSASFEIIYKYFFTLLAYVHFLLYLCSEIGFLGHLCALSRKHL